MKLRTQIRFALLAVVPMVSGIASAASPTLGGWSVNNGTITPNCATGNCNNLIAEPGFVQQQAYDAVTGRTYIRTIVTDPNATAAATALGTLSFYDENYINMSGSTSNGGILGRTYAAASPGPGVPCATATTANCFHSQTDLDLLVGVSNTGAGATPGITLVTMMHAGLGTTGGIKSDFTAEISRGGADLQTTNGTAINIDESVNMSTGAFNALDSQVFALRERSGNQTSAGTWAGFLGQGSAPSLTWVAGERVRAFVIGQSIPLGSSMLPAAFGHLQVQKLNASGVVTSEVYSQTTVNPPSSALAAYGNWDTATFDAKPIIP